MERFNKYIAYGLMAIILLASPLVTRVPPDNRLEVFLDQNTKVARQYQDFLETFGSDEWIVIGYTGRDFFDEEVLDIQLDVLKTMEAIPAIKRVSGIPQVYRDIFGEEDPKALQEEILSTPFYKNLILSEDGQVAGMLIETEPESDMAARRSFLQKIRECLTPIREAGFEVHLIGPPVFHVSVEESMFQEMISTFPVAVFLSLMVLVLLFRSIKATLVALLTVFFSVLLAVEFMALCGAKMNIISSSLPLLLWVLGLANLIHIIRRYQEDRDESRSMEEDVFSALRATYRPCVVAILTTAMGFISVTVSGLKPLREVGFFGAMGLVFSLLVSFTLCPRLILFFRVPGLKRSRAAIPWTRKMSDRTLRLGVPILMLTLILVFLALGSLGKIQVDFNILYLLPQESEIFEAYQFIKERLTGFHTLELVVETPNGWLDEKWWGPLEQVQKSLEDDPDVAKVISPMDFLKKINHWMNEMDPQSYRLPGSGEKGEEWVGLLDETMRPELDRLLQGDGKAVRISVLVRELDANRILDIARKAQAFLENPDFPVDGYVTGIVFQVAETQIDIVETLVGSFGIAFVTVLVCIFLGLRSWQLTLFSLLPNLLPILFMFGIMSGMGIPLNPVTTMVASLALGIAVDDAVHMLNAYQRFRKMGRSDVEAIQLALDKVGPSITMTTVTACIGFFALSRSAFLPIEWFGMLSGIAIVIALLSNLLVVPSIVTLKEKVKILWPPR